MQPYTDEQACNALLTVIGNSRWDVVCLARGYKALLDGLDHDIASRRIYEHGEISLKNSKAFLTQSKTKGFVNLLTPRNKIGSAENPITKLFPATITEQRFLFLLDNLKNKRPTIDYTDDREMGHGLTDFTLIENNETLPINIKNAGTRFENAQRLVGLNPEDCLPIPAYKANSAIESCPNLIYVISMDFTLLSILDHLLPTLFNENEAIVWDILNKFGGGRLRNAEDLFVFSMVRKYWDRISEVVYNTPFHVISARKAIRILHTQPSRTPGIGLRAWGTGASAEVNVHVSVQQDTTCWSTVEDRIVSEGIGNIVRAVNRRCQEIVYDPEI